nr:uncharacterized protein LOC112546744 [Pelodiscus sinensis]|eukprot:XP_025043382.1 uncharacterized protein LOC112546744 [Pelodiscus sinensis]
MSAQPGDSVQVRCFMSSWHLATRIVFCKDGEEVSFQTGSKKATYDYIHSVSSNSSGNYSCGYEIKDSNSRVNGSQLSTVKRLSVTSSDSSSGGTRISSSPGNDSSSGGTRISSSPGLDLKLLLGITVPAVLVLAVVLYLLGRKAGSLWREHREHVQRDTSSAAQEHECKSFWILLELLGSPAQEGEMWGLRIPRRIGLEKPGVCGP